VFSELNCIHPVQEVVLNLDCCGYAYEEKGGVLICLIFISATFYIFQEHNFFLPHFKMNRNLQSPSGLTEFAPLSPEPSQPGVGFLLSKFFRLNRGKSHYMEHFNITVLCFSQHVV
jgi:hypothetical protein